jgi:hypothetical protein
MNYAPSGLVSSASEFVPGKYHGREAGAQNYQTDSELKSSANEWVPGSGGGGGLGSMKDMSYALPDASSYPQSGTDGVSEPMIEAYWNGTTVVVPQSSTYVAEDGTVMYMGGDVDGLAAIDPSGTLAGDSRCCCDRCDCGGVKS